MRTFLDLELTNKCNYRCEFCYNNKSRDNSDIDFESCMDVLNANAKLKVDGICFNSVQLNGQGEPLLYKRIQEVVREAKSLGYYVELITNGYLLTDEISRSLLQSGVDSIVVSITGVKPEVYSKFQGSGVSYEQAKKNMNRVIDNIQNLCRLRNTRNTTIGLRYIKDKKLGSASHLREYLKFWKNIGVDFVSVTGLHDYDEKAVKLARCAFVDRRFQICANGTVSPCSCDVRKERGQGRNVHEQSFESIVSATDFIQTRRDMMSVDPLRVPEGCRLCEHHRLLPFFGDRHLKRHTVYYGKPIKSLISRLFGPAVVIYMHIMRSDVLYALYLSYLRRKSKRERKAMLR